MEYRFRAKKTWNLPNKVKNIILFAVFISVFFPKNIEHPWVYYSFLIFGVVFLGFCYRELGQKIILTISDAGISYSGNDFLFANTWKSLGSNQLSKILIADNEPADFRARWFTSNISIFDQPVTFIQYFEIKQWQPLDNLDLEQALKTCFNDKVESANRSKIFKMVNEHQNVKGVTELGKVAGYFVVASIGIAWIGAALAFLDSNTTIAWGDQYGSLIWGVALIIAVTSLATLVRSKTHIVALVLVSLIFTTVMTFFIHQSFMLINFHFGQQKSYQFEKVFQNKDYESWLTATGERVECAPSPKKLHDYKTGIVRVGMLGIVRTQIKEVCMFPLERKKGKAA